MKSYKKEKKECEWDTISKYVWLTGISLSLTGYDVAPATGSESIG